MILRELDLKIDGQLFRVAFETTGFQVPEKDIGDLIHNTKLMNFFHGSPSFLDSMRL